MCKLCSNDPDEVKQRRRELLHLSNSLDRMSNYVYQIASGEIEMHSEKDRQSWNLIAYLSKDIIKELVEWM